MSSNIKIKKVCQYCGNVFMAKTTVTRYCSHKCNSADYKKQLKDKKVADAVEDTKLIILNEVSAHKQVANITKELVKIKELAIITSLSERTLFRLIKENKDFPKVKIGKRLAFHKDTVINYLNKKYGNL
jgi:predicted DNA-binding transcriptional regulator AlpA/ribosomal protein S27AE